MVPDDYKTVLKVGLIKKTEIETKEINDILNKKLDWVKIAGILLNHRLGGYFFFGLDEQQKKKVPREIIRALELLVLGQTIRQKELNPEIEKISERLERTDIRYAGLKGVIFGTEIYPIGIRRSNDIDILVYEKDLDKLDHVLRELGYIQTNNRALMIEASKKEKVIQRMNYHDLVPYIKKMDNKLVEIDINFLFDNKTNLIDKKVFEFGTKIYRGKEYNFRGLKTYTGLSFLCVHFYREATDDIWIKSKRNVTLYKLVDIINYVRKYKMEMDASALIDVFQSLNIIEKCYCVFSILLHFYEDDFVKTVFNQMVNKCTRESQDVGSVVKGKYLEGLFEESYKDI